jgi:hypothetical protein
MYKSKEQEIKNLRSSSSLIQISSIPNLHASSSSSSSSSISSSSHSKTMKQKITTQQANDASTSTDENIQLQHAIKDDHTQAPLKFDQDLWYMKGFFNGSIELISYMIEYLLCKSTSTLTNNNNNNNNFSHRHQHQSASTSSSSAAAAAAAGPLHNNNLSPNHLNRTNSINYSLNKYSANIEMYINLLRKFHNIYFKENKLNDSEITFVINTHKQKQFPLNNKKVLKKILHALGSECQMPQKYYTSLYKLCISSKNNKHKQRRNKSRSKTKKRSTSNASLSSNGSLDNNNDDDDDDDDDEDNSSDSGDSDSDSSNSSNNNNNSGSSSSSNDSSDYDEQENGAETGYKNGLIISSQKQAEFIQKASKNMLNNHLMPNSQLQIRDLSSPVALFSNSTTALIDHSAILERLQKEQHGQSTTESDMFILGSGDVVNDAAAAAALLDENNRKAKKLKSNLIQRFNDTATTITTQMTSNPILHGKKRTKFNILI